MNRTESVVRRRTSNTPLQALTLMNDPQFVEAYRELATDTIYSVNEGHARLARLYRVATRMTPSDAVLARLDEYYQLQRANFLADEARARELIATGVTEPDPDLEPATLAALTNVAALIMNSPEAYTVR